MFEAVDAALARLYPTKTWGVIDDEAAFGAGVDAADGIALADELASELEAATFFRPGSEDELCDWIYVLCLGRPPCLVQVRDAEVPPPAEWDGPVHEQYLRICLSSVARMVGVQQVALDLEPTPGGVVIRERPRAGVYDAPLLRRFQRLVAVLPAYDLLHLDFGEISAPPPGFDAGGWPALYAGAPATANFLFYPQPVMMVTTTFVPTAVSARVARA
jgi:hypothetical protein